MKAYPTYKDSGVPWLGEVPEHWGISQYRAYFQERNSPNTNLQESNLLSISYGKIIQKDINKTEGLLPASFESYNIIEVGDIVLRLTDLQNDHKSLRTALCTQKGIITSAYVTLQPINQTVNSAYFQYQLHIYDVRKAIYGAGGGVRQTLNYDAIVRLKSCVPSVEEQNAIVAYLDKKCAEIEELISRRQSIIERLRELKQSIIADAVTKGLHPEVPMKDSGIAWLGEVPQHWNIERLQWHLREIKEINSPIKTNRVLSLTNKKGVIPYEEKGNQGNKAKASHDEYKLAYPDTLVMNSMNVIIGSVGICNYFGCVSPVYYIFKTAGETMLSFVNYVFQTTRFQKELRRHAKGILEIRLRLSSGDILKRLVAFPPLHEQQSIVAYLDKKCAEIDELVARQEQIIEKLKELKTSTIAHVVTGKVDVRDVI